MFITTKGIVLRVFPFKDGKLIVKLFTKEDGLISCIVKKKSSQTILCQLLTIAEITYRKHKPDSLVYIKEARVDYIYKNLTTCPNRIHCSMVLCEILNKCLNESSPVLYDLVAQSFIEMDSLQVFAVGCDSLFLVKFCKTIGIHPLKRASNNGTEFVLSIKDGCYINASDAKNNHQYVPIKESKNIYQLSSMDFKDLPNYCMEPELNTKVFNYLVSYISVHLTDLTKLKSTQILKQLV